MRYNTSTFFKYALILKILNNLKWTEQLLDVFKFRSSVRNRENSEMKLYYLFSLPIAIFGSSGLSLFLNKHYLNTF